MRNARGGVPLPSSTVAAASPAGSHGHLGAPEGQTVSAARPLRARLRTRERERDQRTARRGTGSRTTSRARCRVPPSKTRAGVASAASDRARMAAASAAVDDGGVESTALRPPVRRAAPPGFRGVLRFHLGTPRSHHNALFRHLSVSRRRRGLVAAVDVLDQGQRAAADVRLELCRRGRGALPPLRSGHANREALLQSAVWARSAPRGATWGRRVGEGKNSALNNDAFSGWHERHLT